MDENVVVSVIMPVYKVSEYVGKAIESIQAQTFKNWELWAVDDGSPDDSGEICEQFAKTDDRIHVIHKENGGAPSARNMAIDKACGKYFYFMDSDDWAEPTMFQDMVEIADNNDLELLISGFYIDTYYSDTEKFTQIQSGTDVIYKSKQDFRSNAYKLFDENLLYTPWNKLYLAKYLKEKKLYFPQTLWDDFPFNLSVIRNVEKVGVTSRRYYHFIRKRAESETAKYNPKMYDKREEEHQWMLDLYKFWNISDENSREMIARRYIERLIGCLENYTNSHCSLSKSETKDCIKAAIKSHNCRTSLRIMKPRSFIMKMMIVPLRLESFLLTKAECKFISNVKGSNTKVFATLKARR